MSFSPSNQPFKDEIELKSDLRSDTLDTRQEYDLKVSSETNTSWQKLECIDYKQPINGWFQSPNKSIMEQGFG